MTDPATALAGQRSLVPTAREVELGREPDPVAFGAPMVVTTVDPLAASGPKWRRPIDYVRSLDPRLLKAPLLPLFAVGFVATVQQWDAYVFALVAPDIQSSLGIDLFVLTGVGALVAFVTQLFAPVVGFLADRWNRVRMIRIGALVANAGYLAIGAATGLPGLVWARVAQSMGALTLTPPGYTLLPDYYPVAARIQVISFLFAVGGVVTLFVPLVGGVVTSRFGWRVTILAFGVLALAFTTLVFFVRETTRGYWERKALGATEEVARREQTPASWSESWRTMARTGTVRWQWCAAPFLTLASTFSLLFPNLYYAQRFGLAASSRGAITATSAAVGLFALLFVAPYAGRIANGRPRFLVAFTAAQGVWSALCYVGLYFSGNVYLAVVFTSLQAAAANMLFPLSFGLLTLVIPPRVRGFGVQTLTFAALPGTLLFDLYFQGTNDLHTAITWLVITSVVGTLLLLPALGTVERDERAGIASALADEAAMRARLEGRSRLLLCRDVQMTYAGAQVLFGVDLDVDEGEIVALLGTNGAGKSTLLRAIAGVQEASGGAVFFDGVDITHRPPHQNAAAGIVMVPGGQAGSPSLTVEDGLRIAGRGHADVDERMARAFDLFPVLRERRGKPAGALSGGEQQMLALAQALLMEPRLLMIDELSLGLAPAVVEQLLDRLRELNERGTTILLVEQSLNVALTIARRAVFMDRGEVRFDGSTEELLSRPDLVRAVFMGSATSGGSRPARRLDPRSGTETVLAVDGASLAYGGVQALTDVSLSVDAREIVGVVGPNGAGKTTLFDVISGLVAPDAGTVTLKGANVNGWPLDRRAAAGLGRSFQNARLFPSMTVRENVAVALHRHIKSRNPLLAAAWAPPVRDAERRVRTRVDDVLELLGLQAYADKFVGELSTGSRRAVDVACVMVSAPDVLLLDEPSSGLAQAETEALGPVLLRLVRETGCGIVLIEHDLPLVLGVADRLVALELGHVLAAGTPAEVLADPQVQRAYLSASPDVLQRSGSGLSDALAAAGLAAAELAAGADAVPDSLQADALATPSGRTPT